LALQGDVYEKWLFQFNVENIRILTMVDISLGRDCISDRYSI